MNSVVIVRERGKLCVFSGRMAGSCPPRPPRPVDHLADVFIHGWRCTVHLVLRLSGRQRDIFQSETLALEI